MWIDENTHDFRSIVVSLDPASMQSPDSAQRKTTMKRFDIKLDNMKYNEPFTFTPPTSSRKIEDVFSEIMQSLFGGMIKIKKN